MKFDKYIVFCSFVLAVFSLTQCIGARANKDITLHDTATVVRNTDYQILGSGTGEASAFYLLGFLPVSGPPNVELALSQILEKYPDGKTLVNIKIQKVDKPYFPLGLVTVLSVYAEVVGEPTNQEEVKK